MGSPRLTPREASRGVARRQSGTAHEEHPEQVSLSLRMSSTPAAPIALFTLASSGYFFTLLLVTIFKQLLPHVSIFFCTELSQTTEARLPATIGRVTIPDPSDTLGDPVVEQTVRKMIETAGRLVAIRNAPGSGVTSPYGTIDDTGRVQLYREMMTRTKVSDTTLPTKSSEVPDRKVREKPMKKVFRVIDVQKNNQLKYSFTGDPDTDSRACFNRSTCYITSDTG